MPSGDNWIRYNGVTYHLRQGERALDAMIRAGAPVSFSCRKGSCRSCMLQVTSGDVGENAIKSLPSDLRAAGFFLPCCADTVSKVEAIAPDPALCATNAMLAEKQWMAPDIVRLKFELERLLDWLPGQTITIANPDGVRRQFSISSTMDDYYLVIDVKVYPQGAVSQWLAETVEPGATISIQGPVGNFVYDPVLVKRPVLLIATGSGGGAALGVARDALAKGHAAPIYFYHGARRAASLYLKSDLAEMTAPNLIVRQIASRETTADQPGARVADVAFAEHPDLSAFAIFICGNADMVESARVRAVAAGAAPDQIITDPFDQPTPYSPRDAEKLKALLPDPEIWGALDHGRKLTPILEDFYTRVYADPRLEPFFYRVTKSRAVEKQYNFLQDRFTGTKQYFGEKPFNAHHWMVISDDLFDHREALFFATLRDHNFPEHLIPRWAALHETFRRDIVKSSPRGHFRNGVEHDLEGYRDEIVSVGTVCDSCVSEIHEGDAVRMHRRTGEIFCMNCANAPARTSAA